MKKTALIFILMTSALSPILAQPGLTYYGYGIGQDGDYSSYFGYYSGENANQYAADNSFFGANSGRNTTSGIRNTAIGSSALYLNTTGYSNTALGFNSLAANTTGYYNVASGPYALTSNTTGHSNNAFGYISLYNNSTGVGNVAIGYSALYNNTTGSNNTALGYNAGPNASNYSNTTALGNGATTTASNQIRIGNSSVTSIGGQVSWSTLSDGRFKTDVKDDVSGLSFINELKPVSYNLDKIAVNKFLGVLDNSQSSLSEGRVKPARQIGFIAQDVEEVIKKTGYIFSGLEAPKSEKDHYSLRYSEFVVPLVKAVQELSGKMEEQQMKIERLTNLLLNNGALANDQIISALGASLLQNSPNPFTSDTEIKMIVPETVQNAQIIIYNMEGTQVKAIEVQQRGSTSVKISASELKYGIYIYSLVIDNKIIDTKRLILTK